MEILLSRSVYIHVLYNCRNSIYKYIQEQTQWTSKHIFQVQFSVIHACHLHNTHITCIFINLQTNKLITELQHLTQDEPLMIDTRGHHWSTAGDHLTPHGQLDMRVRVWSSLFTRVALWCSHMKLNCTTTDQENETGPNL